MRHLLCGLAFGAAVVAATVPLAADAQDRPFDTRSSTGNSNANGPKPVPEFDPATVGAIAAIVAGGGVLIARRRRR